MSGYVTISTPPIQTTIVSSATSITTTSGTDAVMTGMTVTPIAGTYFVIFTGNVQMNLAGDFIFNSIYMGGTQDTTSILQFAPFAGGTLTAGQASVPITNQGVYTVNGSQAIDIRWHVSGGTGTSTNRKMTLLRIS